MDEAAPARRRWSQSAREALHRAVQASEDYRPQLEGIATAAKHIENEAHDNPALIAELVPHVQRDLAEIERVLADIRSWMIDPRPDPTGAHERWLGWPEHAKATTHRLAELAGEAVRQAGDMQDWLDNIAREAHDNPKVVKRLAILLQRDGARIAATLATIRSDLLQLSP
ncbi:MAG TPA: hypothetical protein VFS21_25190 [Roseiflexaceae bacterium]|nr:hypothetical protein [Roseiflexaceae bacterium]